MLKWTVSRSLSTASSTPHGPPTLGKAPRRPFRDLSNTPPAPGSATRAQLSNAPQNAVSSRPTPVPARRRRRCRSHGTDLRSYFQATKPNLRSGKRQSLSQENQKSPSCESYYQSTPRVDTDIGPLTIIPRQSSLTLPSDPVILMRTTAKKCQTNGELPQNIVNEARVNLQSHVSDFFHQISMAASPEDVMESDSVPHGRSRLFIPSCEARSIFDSEFAGRIPKVARVTKLNQRCKTPYHTKVQSRSPLKGGQHTPLVGKLSHLRLDQDLLKYENVDNTVTEAINRQNDTNYGGQSVAEILLKDAEERRKVLENGPSKKLEVIETAPTESPTSEHIYETISDTKSEIVETMDLDVETAAHNNSTVSSASQLLENPSPLLWALRSPSADFEEAFTLRRQRGIRRKRQQKDNDRGADNKRSKKLSTAGNSPKRKKELEDEEQPETLPFIEAINRDVKTFVIETNLDTTVDVAKTTCDIVPTSSEVVYSNQEEIKKLADSVEGEKREDEHSRKALAWDWESPKSSMLDDFMSSKSCLTSMTNTPETPLVATVRRCLKYSPESEPSSVSRMSNFSRGSIELECFESGDQIFLKVIRCKDLRRSNEGSIHAYVKASLKNSSNEGAVKRTAVHRATPNPDFNETLIFPCPAYNNCTSRAVSLDIAVWHRDRRARRSELLGCMTLPLPLSQDKEATWHPLEAGSGRNTSTPYSGVLQECGVSPPLSKDGETDNNNTGGEDFTYLRHLELEPLDPLTGLPIHPGIAARGGRTPCTVTRTLVRPYTDNPVPWGFSLSWCRPPRVERVNTGSAAERVGLRPGDYVIFIDSTNVVTQPQEKILELIKAATNKLVLEVYRKGGFQGGSVRRPSSVNVAFQQPHNNQHHSIAFTAEAHPNLGPDATPEEELSVREMRYWMILKSGQLHYVAPLAERQDVLSAADHMILFQNFDELLKLSEEIKDEGGGIESYVMRVPRITAAYRRYLSGLQRACCLLVALRKNAGFEELVSEQTIPQKPKPDITGILLQPLEHYREMTRLLVTAFPRNCQKVRDLSQGYREATANAGVMEPPQDTGRPLLSLQEVESRLVFAKCKPFSLTTPGRQWLFGGALAKVEGRTQMQPIWALLLTDLLVFARVLRNRVLSVTEEPLWISNIAEACFNVRKSPTEFRLSVNTSQTEDRDNKHLQIGNSGGCSPHSRPQRRILILRAPSLELKAVWHNLLQRQLIYVNGCGGPREYDPLQECLLPTGPYLSARDCTPSPEIYKSAQQLEQEPPRSIDAILKNANHDSNHLSRWVQNSNQIPPDHDVPIEEWTAEELVARTPRDTRARQISEGTMEDSTIVNSDVEQQSSTSSASMSTVRSSHLHKKSGSYVSSKENSSGSINICKRCHKSGCPTPPLSRDPFSPLPPKISVLPPTPDLCSRHRLRNGLHDSPGRGSPNCSSFDGNTEDGSEDDLDCDGETPYKTLRRYDTVSSLDQDELDGIEEDTHEFESLPSGHRSGCTRTSTYVVGKMAILEQYGDGGCCLHTAQIERSDSFLDPNDEEGTTSGGTSGDDIWGTPTSGGLDDDSFTNSPPPSNGVGSEEYGLGPDDDADGEDDGPDVNIDQLLGAGNLGSLRNFLNRRKLEPLPEEEDSTSGKQESGWW